MHNALTSVPIVYYVIKLKENLTNKPCNSRSLEKLGELLKG